jgi:hypothetical protein
MMGIEETELLRRYSAAADLPTRVLLERIWDADGSSDAREDYIDVFLPLLNAQFREHADIDDMNDLADGAGRYVNSKWMQTNWTSHRFASIILSLEALRIRTIVQRDEDENSKREANLNRDGMKSGLLTLAATAAAYLLDLTLGIKPIEPNTIAIVALFFMFGGALVFWIKRLIAGNRRKAFVNPEHKQEVG